MATLYEENNLSPNPVDILCFDNFFLGADIARRLIFREKRNGLTLYLTMDVDPGYNHIEKFSGAVEWFILGSKDFILSIKFEIKTKTTN